MIATICIVTLILLIWFKTDAFIVYSKLFGLGSRGYIDEWELFKNTQDATVTYHQYLRIKNPDGFWTKLITCPICLGIWICFIVVVLTTSVTLISSFPIVCLSSLFLYYLLVRIMG